MARLGKIRGLQRLYSRSGIACVLAVDHGSSFRTRLRDLIGRDPSDEDVTKEKRRILRYLAIEATGTVCDPGDTLRVAVEEGLVPPDRGLVAGFPDVPILWRPQDGGPWPELTISQAKTWGCDAVKVCIIAGATGAGQDKVELAKSIGSQCKELELPFILEIVAAEISQRRGGRGWDSGPEPASNLEYISEFNDVGADILKLKMPRGLGGEAKDLRQAAACAELTNAARVPWVLLSAGTSFEVFERELEVACRAGASGFVVGTAVWQEALEIPDPYRRDEFLVEVGVHRMKKLYNIAHAHGKRIASLVP